MIRIITALIIFILCQLTNAQTTVKQSADLSESKTKNQEGVTIYAEVTNVLKKGGEVIFALYDSESNFHVQKPLVMKKVVPQNGKAPVSFQSIRPGTYALVALHDMNGNEQMDFENGMPKEDYGSSNNSLPMGPPNFYDSQFTVTNKSVTLEIRF